MGLDVYELVLEVQDLFQVRIENADACAVESVGDLYELTLRSLRARWPSRFAENPLYPDVVWVQLKTLIVEQLGVKPADVVPSARFHYELGFD